jgi:hypothetical protein
MIELPRRKFLTAAAALFCAPGIVRADSLMKYRPMPIIKSRLHDQDLLGCIDSSESRVVLQYEWKRDGNTGLRLMERRLWSDDPWKPSLETTDGWKVLK